MRGPIIDWIKYILQKRKTKKNNKSLRIGYMSFCYNSSFEFKSSSTSIDVI